MERELVRDPGVDADRPLECPSGRVRSSGKGGNVTLLCVGVALLTRGSSGRYPFHGGFCASPRVSVFAPLLLAGLECDGSEVGGVEKFVLGG